MIVPFFCSSCPSANDTASLLRVELQKCLSALKAKREQLQEIREVAARRQRELEHYENESALSKQRVDKLEVCGKTIHPLLFSTTRKIIGGK